jgi:hypothetical protein
LLKSIYKSINTYLGIDSTVLRAKWKRQLASVVGVDGHNWMFPVAYRVFGSETKENWERFVKILHKAIGSSPGLVISPDAGLFHPVLHDLFHSVLPNIVFLICVSLLAICKERNRQGSYQSLHK